MPGGETALAVQGRALAALLSLQQAYPDAELAVVSHGDVVRGLLAHFLGVPLDLARRIAVAPSHRSVVALMADDARIEGMNIKA